MIISIASGKGGTGKTTVATNLARVMSSDAQVTLLDADVEEPNANIFLGIDLDYRQDVCLPVPVIDESLCSRCHLCEKVCVHHAIMVTDKATLVFPEMCHACGGCSLLCPARAISEVNRQIGVIEAGAHDRLRFRQGTLNPGEVFSPAVIRRLKADVTGHGITLIDCPPGTACAAVEAVKGSDLCILVTEPTPFGLHDLALAARMLHKSQVQCAVAINRWGVGDHGVEQYCLDKGIPIIARLPLDREVAEICARGRLVVDHLPEWRRTFVSLADTVISLAGVEVSAHGGKEEHA